MSTISLGAGAVTLGGDIQLVKNSFDAIATTVWEAQPNPGYVDVRDSRAFKQGLAPYGVKNMFDIIPSGYWEEHSELENVKQNAPFTATPFQFTSKMTSNALEFSYEVWNYAFGTGDGSALADMVRAHISSGRSTMNRDGFQIYNNAFTTSLVTGVPLLSASQPTTVGTFSNIVNAATVGTLQAVDVENAIRSLIAQPNKAGIPAGNRPRTLVVSPVDFPNAVTITESKSIAGPLNAQGNPATISYVSAKYNLEVVTSEFISNSMSGAPGGGYTRAAFLLSDNFKIYAWTASNLTTYLQPLEMSKNLSYQYISYYHMIFGAYDGFGIVGIAI